MYNLLLPSASDTSVITFYLRFEGFFFLLKFNIDIDSFIYFNCPESSLYNFFVLRSKIDFWG